MNDSGGWGLEAGKRVKMKHLSFIHLISREGLPGLGIDQRFHEGEIISGSGITFIVLI